MAERTALVLALNSLEYDRRVANEARSLAALGYRVTRVGIRTESRLPEVERTGFDTIVRFTPGVLRAASCSEATVSEAAAPSALVRQWPWKVALMSWARRRFPGAMSALDSLRLWLRLNAALTCTCEDLTPDVVIATDFDTLLAGARIKGRTGCVLIYDAHELWIDMPDRASFNRLLRRCFIALERKLAGRADIVLTVGEGLADVLARRLRRERPLVVMNGPEVVIEPREREVGEPLRVLFQGRIEAGRGLEEAIDAVGMASGRVALTIQGFGPAEDSVRESVRIRGLDQAAVSFAAPCEPGEVVQHASGYDVGLVSVSPTCLNNVLSMPNKLFTFLGGGLAILTTGSAREIASLVRGHECGVVVKEWTPADIADALRWLAENPEELRRQRWRAHELAQELSWERQFAPVAALLT